MESWFAIIYPEAANRCPCPDPTVLSEHSVTTASGHQSLLIPAFLCVASKPTGAHAQAKVRQINQTCCLTYVILHDFA